MASTHPTTPHHDAHVGHGDARTHTASAGTARLHDTHPVSAHGEHVVGTMDVTAQQRTFNGFVRAISWNVVAMLAVLIFLALTNA